MDLRRTGVAAVAVAAVAPTLERFNFVNYFYQIL